MADQKISEMDSVTALSGTEFIPVVQEGANKKATAVQVREYVQDNLGSAAFAATSDFEPAGAVNDVFGPLQTQVNGLASDLSALDALVAEKADQDSVREKLDAIITTESKTGNYTLSAGDLANVDLGKNLEFKSTTGDLTVPTNATVAFPQGVVFWVEGFANVIASVGVTVTGTRGDLTIPTAGAALKKTGTDTWTLYNGTADSGGGTWGSITGTLSDQTDLNSELSAKAPLASPTFTGTPAAPTAAVDTNTTQIATTAFVIAQQEAQDTSYDYWQVASFRALYGY